MNDQKKGQSYGPKKRRRQMKTFFQINMLESTYASNAYPSMGVRAKLSESLGLTDRQLQTWFSQRRIRDKKKRIQERVGSGSSSSLESSSESESGSSSYSSHFNEPLVHSRANELTKQKMTLKSLADCAIQLGEPLCNNGPEEETRDVEKDSEPKEERPTSSKRCVTTRKINNKKRTESEKLAVVKASVNTSKDPMHGNKKRASSFLAKLKTVAPMGAEFGQSAKRSKTSTSNTDTTSSEGESQPMDLGTENEVEFPAVEEVERPQRKLKKPTPSSSTSTDTKQNASKLNNHVKQDVKKLDHFRSEKLRIKEEEKQAKVRTLEAQERAFQKQERLLELQCKALERQEKKEDLELFLKLNDHLSGQMLRVTLEQKREIAEKWGWKWE